MRGLVLLMILPCCGVEEKIQESVPQSPSRCLSCGQNYITESHSNLPQPRIFLYPEELLFYYTNNSETPYPSQYISVVNRTKETIIITNATITKDNTCLICGSGNPFTFVNPKFPQTLEPDKTLPLEISFSFSTAQQDAILKVYTAVVLEAELYGKVIVW